MVQSYSRKDNECSYGNDVANKCPQEEIDNPELINKESVLIAFKLVKLEQSKNISETPNGHSDHNPQGFQKHKIFSSF